jgi:uncharacterized OB-fold protein
MGTKYICDSCGKEFDVKGGSGGPGSYAASPELPDKWVVLTYVVKAEKPGPDRGKQTCGYAPYESESRLVCSQACAEKSLAEIGALLKDVFGEAVS